MGTHKRRIHKERAWRGGGVRLQTLPAWAPEPAPFPAAQAVRDGGPASKRLWQVTPGRARYRTAARHSRSLSPGGLPARDVMAVRMEASSAQASSVSNKRPDIRFPLACL